MNELKEMMFTHYANGNVSSAESALISSYLAMNPNDRKQVDMYMAVGAHLMQNAHSDVNISDDALDNIFSKIDAASEAETQLSADLMIDKELKDILPAPLLAYAQDNQSSIVLKTMFPGFKHSVLSKEAEDTHAEILKISPGKPVAEHTHQSIEMTLILDGAFEDDSGYYSTGDLIITDNKIQHQPISDPKMGCVCFTTRTQPLKYTGLLGNLLNRVFKS